MPGWWLMILEAAGFDPFKAQEIEANLTQDWWERYNVYHDAAARVSKEQQRKAEKQQRRRNW